MNISVVGQGKLGLALSLHLESLGLNVLGIEKDKDLIEDLKQRSVETFEPGVKSMLRNSKRYEVISDLDLQSIDLRSDFDLILICINTSDLMSDHRGSFDRSHLTKLFFSLVKNFNQYYESNGKDYDYFHVPIILISTVPVGYCDWIIKKLPCLKLIYHPLFIAQGSILSDLRDPDLVLIGSSDPELPKSVFEFFSTIYHEDIPRKIMSYKEAELTKLIINSYLCAKITFANIIGNLCETMGVSSSKVLSAVGTDKRIGHKCLKHGLPIGGACLPTDLNCLIRNAGSAGSGGESAAQLLGSVKRSDRDHLDHLVDQYLKMNLDVYMFTDVGYKPGVPLLDNSPKLKIVGELLKYGKKVVIEDSEYVIEQIRKMELSDSDNLIVKVKILYN
jgi:UDPglucose 6-dehydrogenase